VQVAVEDLLSEGEALLAEDAADLGVLVEELLVGGGQGLDGRVGSGMAGEVLEGLVDAIWESANSHT
jgi:hypothetical protein